MKPDRRWACFKHQAPESHTRNKQMLARRQVSRESGFDVAKNAGVDFKVYYLLEKKQKDPLCQRRERWRKSVYKLCEYWSCEPEDIWPEEAEEYADYQPGSAEPGLSQHAIRSASPDYFEYVCDAHVANKVFNDLNSHDQAVIRDYLVDEVSVKVMQKKYGVTETTIHNWIYEAIRKLRAGVTGVFERDLKIVKFLGPAAYERR